MSLLKAELVEKAREIKDYCRQYTKEHGSCTGCPFHDVNLRHEHENANCLLDTAPDEIAHPDYWDLSGIKVTEDMRLSEAIIFLSQRLRLIEEDYKDGKMNRYAAALELAIKALEKQIDIGQTIIDYQEHFKPEDNFSLGCVLEDLNSAYILSDVNEGGK